MDSEPISHPDRVATTLATIEAARAARSGARFAPPEAGSADCRIDLKLLIWRARQACARSPAARERLAAFEPEAHPDLWAGTVQDGTARGFAAALEEAVDLAAGPVTTAAVGTDPDPDPGRTQVLEGKQLRRKKDILVASGGSRVRFTRRDGLLYVDRASEVHSANCLRFEARADHGTLDGFRGDDATRPRLFSAQFLQPVRYAIAPGYGELELAGRIGRGPVGWHAGIRIVGREAEPALHLEIRIDNDIRDWRLRARFLGIDPSWITHDCTDMREVIAGPAGSIVAFTLVRACGLLNVDGEPVAVPAAQCPGRIVHRFRLGPR